MGYRGKLAERQQARQLRRTGLPLAEIAGCLGVSKSSVSLWVRDVAFEPLPAGPAVVDALPTPCSAASRPRSTSSSPRGAPGSAGCQNGTSWWPGWRCTRGKAPSGMGP